MSWYMDPKLVSLLVTGMLVSQTQSPASAESENHELTENKQQQLVKRHPVSEEVKWEAMRAIARKSALRTAALRAGGDVPIIAEAIHTSAAPQTRATATTPPEHQSEWETLNAKAKEFERVGDKKNAEKYFHQTYELAKTFSPEDLRRTKSVENLADILEQQGRYTNAQGLFQEAFELRKEAYGESSALLSKSYYNIGRVQMLAGEYGKARENLKKALDLRQFSSSEEANKQDLPLVRILSNLGALETETGNFEKAEEHLHRAQTIAQNIARHDENARIYSQLSLLSLAEKDYPKAENQAYSSVSMADKFAKGNLLLRAQALDSVAMVKLARGNYFEATEACNESWGLKRKELGQQHPLTANSLLTLGLIKIAEKKYSEAQKSFDDAIAAYNHSLNQSHLSYSRALMGRAFVHLKLKNKSASSKDIEQAMQSMSSTQSVGSELPARYKELYIEHVGPNFNLIEVVKEKMKSPGAVAAKQFDIFGQLLSIAVDDGDSDEAFFGAKYKDVFAVLGITFVVIVMLAMAVLIPGAFTRLFPWGKNEDDFASGRNKSRKQQNTSQNLPALNQPQPQQTRNTMRQATPTERRQVQVWKGRLNTMEHAVPGSKKKANTGSKERLNFKPSDTYSGPIQLPSDISTPVQAEGSSDPFWKP